MFNGGKVLLWMGQSNAKGSAEPYGGDQTIESGVYIWDGLNFVPPQFGIFPLSTSGSNNACISCANELRKYYDEDIYIILNAQGGQSLSTWVGSNDTMWQNLIDQITTSGVDSYSRCVVGIGWMQGESDSTTAITGYETYYTYKAGLDQLLSRLRSLNCVGECTPFVTSGLGEWKENGATARNDVLLSLNDSDDIWTGNISVEGLNYTSTTGTSHFNGDSLVKVGKRIASKILKAPYEVGDQNKSLKTLGAYVGTTVELEPMDLKNGAQILVSNATIKVPLAFRYNGAILRVMVSSITSGNSILDASPQGIRVNNIEYTTFELDKAGVWEFVAINNRLHFLNKPY